MDIDTVFSTEEWDAVSDLPTLHLSALIHTFLPIHLVEWKNVKRHFESATAGINESVTEESKETVDILVTGSAAEGYGLPIVTKRSSIEVLSDVDMLYINKRIPVSSKDYDGNNTDVRAYLDYKNVHPGYARICIPRIKEKDDTFVYVEEEGKYFLSSGAYIRKMISTQDKLHLDEATEMTVQGPAITLNNFQELTEENFKRPDVGLSEDIVCALPCFPWPDVAKGLHNRALKSQWLQSSLIESIINDGCHIVAIPSKNSSNPELEWRLSFSASEGRLAREAVTDQQRQCYVFLKILRYQVMKTVLSSYVFKCIFLHCCEQLPVDSWKTYPANCVLYMLDVLLECLRKKSVPTFFLPENNIIDHLSDEELNTAISAVEKLRSDPITPVLSFTNDNLLACHCINVPFRLLIKPLLDDIDEYRRHRNKELSIFMGIYATYYSICVSILKEESPDKEAERLKRKEAVRFIQDLFRNWIVPLQHSESMSRFLNSFGLSLKDTELSMRFFESMVSLSDEYQEFSAFRGNLACMYHSFAYKHDDGSLLRTEFINKAGVIFKQIYDENKESAIDYVTYLIKQKKYDQAEEVLEEILKEDNKINNVEFVYDCKELESLGEHLRNYVQDNGKICGDTMSFAYFYKVKCITAKDPSQQSFSMIRDLLAKFQDHCQKMKKESLFTLLQLTQSLAKQSGVTDSQCQ